MLKLKPRTKIVHEIIFIEWYDASAKADWADMTDVMEWSKEDFIVREVGWIIYESKNWIIISSQLADDNFVGNRTKIPKKWIISRKIIQ